MAIFNWYPKKKRNLPEQPVMNTWTIGNVLSTIWGVISDFLAKLFGGLPTVRLNKDLQKAEKDLEAAIPVLPKGAYVAMSPAAQAQLDRDRAAVATFEDARTKIQATRKDPSLENRHYVKGKAGVETRKQLTHLFTKKVEMIKKRDHLHPHDVQAEIAEHVKREKDKKNAIV